MYLSFALLLLHGPQSDYLSEARCFLKEAQQEISRPVAFRPHLTMDLAFSGRGFKLPTVKLCLLGAGHIHFEVFFHGLTS